MHDFSEYLRGAWAVATTGPLVLPIWSALLLVMISSLRGPVVGGIFGALRIQDSALRNAIRQRLDRPLQLILLLLALLPFLSLVMAPLGGWLVTLVHALIVFLLCHLTIQALDIGVFNWYMGRREAAVSAVIRAFSLSILYALALLMVLDWGFGVSVLPLLATSTVLAAVLGLSMQDTLRNAFAGLNMSIEHSFEEGDWVLFRLDVNEQWFGQIVEIGWRTTKIKTLNNNYAVIPNAQFTSHELINFNRPDTTHARAVNVPVEMGHLAVEAVRQALVKSAQSVEGVLATPVPEAYPVEVKTAEVVFQLRFWLDDPSQREILTGAVLEKAWQNLQIMKTQGA